MMRELVNDPFYETIRNYDRCIINYCLMEDEAPYRGMQSHKKAVECAMLKAVDRSIENKSNAEIKLGKENFL